MTDTVDDFATNPNYPKCIEVSTGRFTVPNRPVDLEVRAHPDEAVMTAYGLVTRNTAKSQEDRIALINHGVEGISL